jgi:tetratricopeptide (TPR) repeat protein
LLAETHKSGSNVDRSAILNANCERRVVKPEAVVVAVVGQGVAIALVLALVKLINARATVRIRIEQRAHVAPFGREAHEDYLRGRYHWSKRTQSEIRTAIQYFEKAIARDPGYARAYAGLADCYALMSGYSLIPPDEFMPKARAALKALELDDNLAEAHVSLPVIAQDYDWDWQTAEREFQRAIELDPSYVTAHHWYAEHLAFRGRFTESLAEMQRARQLDPLSLIMAADYGVFMLYARQYDAAIEQFRSVVKVEPHFARTLLIESAYVQKGLFESALADLRRRESGEDPINICMLRAYTYGRAGRMSQAQQELKKLRRLTHHRPLDIGPLLVAYIGLGDKNRAFQCLEEAYAEHSPVLTALKVDPFFDPLRDDPRFAELLHKVRLE